MQSYEHWKELGWCVGLKIMVISWRDSTNIQIVNVLHEMVKRGHQVTIFQYQSDMGNSWMFDGLHATFKSICDLNPETAKEFDVAFCAHFTADLALLDIYCFAFDCWGLDFATKGGGDFQFTTRSNPEMLNRKYKCASMTIGIPKNDTFFDQADTNYKRILYVDSGHIPYGNRGKAQIADMLLQICQNFPEYELCVKPRWLLADTEKNSIDCTHKNAEHIYTVIKERCHGAIPDNLNLLNEHRDMQELIDSSVSVITLYSMATDDVILRNKGLLIVAGYDCDDTYESRPAHMKLMHDFFSQSGCVIDIGDVIKHLPDGLQPEPSYIRKRFPYKGGASKRIVDVMEFIYDRFLRYGLYPARREYAYEDYLQQMQVDPAITITELKLERMRNVYLNEKFFYQFCRFIPSAAVDFSAFYSELDRTYRGCLLTKRGITEYYAGLKRTEAAIMEDQRGLWKGDSFDEEYWLKMLWEGRLEDKLLSISEDEIVNKCAYHYFLGRVCRKKKMVKEAMTHFYRFIKESPPRPYPKYYSEHDRSFCRAYTYLFTNYDGENLQPIEFADVCFSFYARGNLNLIDNDTHERMLHMLRDVGRELEGTDPTCAAKCIELYKNYTQKNEE